MQINNNKVSIAVHMGYDLCPFSSQSPPSAEDKAQIERLKSTHEEAICTAVSDAFKLRVISRYPLRNCSLEERIEREKDLYNKHTRGIIFARDSLLFVLRHPDGLESDGIISESLYDFAEKNVPPENLIFIPERGQAERVQQAETVIRYLCDALGSIERLHNINLWGFGVYADSCLPQALCSIQRYTKSHALVLGSACDADSFMDARVKVGKYKNTYTKHDPKSQLKVVWDYNDKPENVILQDKETIEQI